MPRLCEPMTYPGGKNGAGVYQKIINLMPPHQVYIEPFLGGAAIMRLKWPASLNIGIDLDREVIRSARAGIAVNDDLGRRRRVSPKTTLRDPVDPLARNDGGARAASARNGDAAGAIVVSDSVRSTFCRRDGIGFLKSYPFSGNELVYCDPPYMHEARKSLSHPYRYEMTDAQHRELLSVITSLPCLVMISGYWTSLYSSRLEDWNKISFQAMTRGGRTATEWLWFNFPEPVQLHDYRYLGENFRERERIKRKKLRWVSRLRRMPSLEKMALLSAIRDVDHRPIR